VTWQPTRQPIALSCGTDCSEARRALTTICRWDEQRRVQQLGETRCSWSKRDEWLKFVDLPQRTEGAFELARWT
jgi:hypothetical protein